MSNRVHLQCSPSPHLLHNPHGAIHHICRISTLLQHLLDVIFIANKAHTTFVWIYYLAGALGGPLISCTWYSSRSQQLYWQQLAVAVVATVVTLASLVTFLCPLVDGVLAFSCCFLACSSAFFGSLLFSLAFLAFSSFFWCKDFLFLLTWLNTHHL